MRSQPRAVLVDQRGKEQTLIASGNHPSRDGVTKPSKADNLCPVQTLAATLPGCAAILRHPNCLGISKVEGVFSTKGSGHKGDRRWRDQSGGCNRIPRSKLACSCIKSGTEDIGGTCLINSCYVECRGKAILNCKVRCANGEWPIQGGSCRPGDAAIV